MFIETKKRVVASLVTLSLVFGVLACFYLLSQPQGTHQPMQAVIAGVVLGLSALVVHLLPARQIASPAPLSAGVRSWSVDPTFEPMTTAEPAGLGLGLTAPMLAMSTAAVVGAPAPAAAPGPLPMPMAPVAPVSSSLAERMAQLDADSDTLTIPQIAPAFALRGRNDDVLVDEEAVEPEEPSALPVLEVAAIARTAPAPAAQPVPETRAAPARTSPPSSEAAADEIGWRGPEPDASPELLRRLVDYWHSEYMHEHERLENLRVLYRRAVERLDRFQASTEAPGAATPEPSPSDILRATTTDFTELSAETEEHSDSSTATMEHFH